MGEEGEPKRRAWIGTVEVKAPCAGGLPGRRATSLTALAADWEAELAKPLRRRAGRW